MPVVDLVVSTPVVKSARVLQLSGLFDVTLNDIERRTWRVDCPFDETPWSVGLIVGPSGSGKTTLARKAFGDCVAEYEWHREKAVVDAFDEPRSIKEITEALSSVGFSSPPSWVRPFGTLSNGEQFRANLARCVLDPRRRIAVDEFTSVVDRTVAKVASAAMGKAVRRTPGKQFVAISCHGDIEEWLCPDWVIEMPSGQFTRRSLRQRPPIALRIERCDRSQWKLFSHYHYLNTTLATSSTCFHALYEGRPVAFASANCAPSVVSYWREHRTVCLPDFQGVGIGNALSEFVAGVMRCKGRPYRSTTGNPAMIRHRLKSGLWKKTRDTSLMTPSGMKGLGNNRSKVSGQATNRFTAGFEYVGPKLSKEYESFFGVPAR